MPIASGQQWKNKNKHENGPMGRNAYNIGVKQDATKKTAGALLQALKVAKWLVEDSEKEDDKGSVEVDFTSGDGELLFDMQPKQSEGIETPQEKRVGTADGEVTLKVREMGFGKEGQTE